MITSKVYNPHTESNEKYYNILNYALIKKDFEGLKFLLTKVSQYTGDPFVQKRINSLFMNKNECNKWFGISEAINQSTVNMAFSGNIKIRVNNNEEANDILEPFIYESDFMETLKEAYSCALSCAGEAVSYIVIRTSSQFNPNTNMKIGNRFIDFEVLKKYEVKTDKNRLIREFYKTFDIWDGERTEKREFKFVYTYSVVNENYSTLKIEGFEKDTKISDGLVKELLEIDILEDEYDFIPYFELRLGRGQLPNAIYIEDSLAENLYFKGFDVQNSQTRKFVPETMMYQNSRPESNFAPLIDDPYIMTHPLRNNIDKTGIVFQEGVSAVKELEQHMKLDILQACLDAKISPISLGFSLLDSLANNTDNPISKERVSIRLRESNIVLLKIFISKIIRAFLKINLIETEITDIAVIFDQYITPSVETLTNVLAKQVQFGLKSTQQAVADLNKNEMSDEEIDEEVARIKDQVVQMDYNVQQRNKNLQNKEEVDDKIDNKEDNVLKSDGIVE